MDAFTVSPGFEGAVALHRGPRLGDSLQQATWAAQMRDWDCSV